MMTQNPGLIVMLGSGETAPSIRKVYHWLFERIETPPQISILETPAGFEPNSDKVAQRVADFLAHRLQNFEPQVTVVPARKRGTSHSPDDAGIIAPMLRSNLIFLGPGSPTYAVRQLQDTLAWHTLVARHCLGASLILASAATLAFSTQTLPVYEIYKVGEDLHWHLGLDFFGLYGLSLVFIPHWNNTEGGQELDTSRCYMGLARYQALLKLLPPNQTVVGIDEHTALVLDVANEKCCVMGKGSVTLVKNQTETKFEAGQCFEMSRLGSFRRPQPQTMIPPEIWQRVKTAQIENQSASTPEPSTEVLALVEKREVARVEKDWSTADTMRDKITELGWHVKDTPNGPELEFIK